LDFGISKFRTEGARVTAAGTTLGTPAFMAPEQLADGSAVGPQADLYAVGAMLYVVLTGKPLFKAATNAELDAQVLTATPRPIIELRPDLPPALAQLITQLLEKSPEARPASARQTLALLKAAAPPTPERVFEVATQLTTGGPPEPKTMIDLPSSITGPTLDLPTAAQREAVTSAPRAPRRPLALIALAIALVSLVVVWLLVAPWLAARNSARPAMAPMLEPVPAELATPAAEKPGPAADQTPPSAEPARAAPERPRLPAPPPAKKKPLGLDKSNPYL
jgi:serine/threonine-protein kinase